MDDPKRDRNELPPDPESFSDAARGNPLFKLAIALLGILAVLGFILALAH